MRKCKKYILGIVSAFLLMFMVGSNVIYAAETTTNDEIASVSGKIVIPLAFSENGIVTGDGVRLRAHPHTNATILELIFAYIACCSCTCRKHLGFTGSSGTNGWI